MGGGTTGLRVCVVGSAPPRRCGIATFSDDLRRALTGAEAASPALQVALTDAGNRYHYGPDVAFEIRAQRRADYRAAAAYIDDADIDVVSLQHEFGIFGGPAGRHVDDLLDRLRTPVVTTLHTVVANPPPDLWSATRRVADRSAKLVVLAERAVELLEEGYGIDRSRVRLIPHGVPSGPELDGRQAKEAIGASGRTVLLTFGLLGPDKGIEVVVEALPEIVRHHPDVVYVVLGATHPHVVRDHGEAYREALAARVGELGLTDHVRFVDRFVEVDELRTHLAAADLYLTPYHGTDQIVSGTLSYAIGMGCVVVSTPYPYARELLADGRGELVPFGDPRAMGATVVALLDDDQRRAAMVERARAHGAAMTWPAVGASYLSLFREVVGRHEQRPRPWVEAAVPAPSFAYLEALSDDVGVFQHAPLGVPERANGYCTDDVGRALVAAVEGVARRDDKVAARLTTRYLSFLAAAQTPTGRFENLLAYDRRFVAGTASEDTLGQAVWGLGTAVMLGSADAASFAAMLFQRALPEAGQLRATRAVSYAMLGVRAFLERYPGALDARRLLRLLADRQLARLGDHRSDGWEWLDDALTYANAVVPESLLRAGQLLDEPRWLDAGRRTLDFLLDATFSDGRFDFVGNDGWWPRDGRRADYGQQPIEAGLTARACVAAHEVTGDDLYLDRARGAVAWLLGRNRLGVALYDPATGRCADGLDRSGVSRNAGAESTICALLGLLALPASGSLSVPASLPAARHPEAPALVTPLIPLRPVPGGQAAFSES